MAGIVAAKIPMVFIEMPDKHIGKIPGCGIGSPKPVNVVMGNKAAVQIQERIELLVHMRHVPGLDDLPEVSYYRQCFDYPSCRFPSFYGLT